MEKRNVPKLRFKEFSDEWEEYTLGSFLSFYTTNSFSRDCLNMEFGEVMNIHYGDIHMKFPTILNVKNNRIPFINNDVDISKINDECYCRNGDLIVADASEDYDDIGKSIELQNIEDKKIVSGLHTILARDTKGVTASKFKGYMMLNSAVRKQIKILAAGAKVLGISKSNLEKVSVKLPSLEEQTKIANFLSNVDKIIEEQEGKVKDLELYKKGMMQKIFKQEIRFKDDNGENYPEWSICKINNIGKLISGIGFSEKYQGYSNFKYKFFKVSDMNLANNKKVMNISNNTVSDEMLKEMKAKPIREQSIIFAKVGAAIFLERKKIVNEKFLIDNNMMALEVSKNNNIEFIYYLLEKIKLSKYAQVGALPSYNVSDIGNIKIKLPFLAEQTKIANFLSNIDNVIEEENKKLEDLRQWKKGLLQQMFV
ncbi:MAG: restriction endonuclease subunit S [Clostridium sp.]|uniref:restriction endonuclease subunit S n=1 Tax=Clostridium tertium TaxID=1559 RepID=UPI0022E92C6E|nr:restriction endonuclease subunit S [Clostridium tertium]MDU1568622.1 restriction endonuclease subunit S [Clostridium sp.]